VVELDVLLAASYVPHTPEQPFPPPLDAAALLRCRAAAHSASPNLALTKNKNHASEIEKKSTEIV
jgi:hypothetical protein